MRISDWSSDVCSSDLVAVGEIIAAIGEGLAPVLDAYRGLHRATGNLEQVAGGLGVDDAQRGFAGAPVVDAHRVEHSLAVRTRTAEHVEGIRRVQRQLLAQAAFADHVVRQVRSPAL